MRAASLAACVAASHILNRRPDILANESRILKERRGLKAVHCLFRLENGRRSVGRALHTPIAIPDWAADNGHRAWQDMAGQGGPYRAQDM
jgi:hypothetical protein